MMTKRFLILLFCALTATACSGDSGEPLPTLVAVATIPQTTPTQNATMLDAPIPSPQATITPQVTTTMTISAGTPSGTSATRISGTTTATFTPSRTITNTRTPTLTLTPQPTAVPGLLDELVALAQQATILPPTYLAGVGSAVATGVIPPTPDPANQSAACTTVPAGGFGVLFNIDPTVSQQLGCPVNAVNVQQTGAVQNFEFGFMIWVAGTPASIYAFYPNGTFTRFQDTFLEGIDPISAGEVPPAANLFEPVRGFGKVWRSSPDMRNTLGWATGGESSGTATQLDFQNGTLLHINTRGDILVLARQAFSESGTWRSAPGAP